MTSQRRLLWAVTGLLVRGLRLHGGLHSCTDTDRVWLARGLNVQGRLHPCTHRPCIVVSRRCLRRWCS